MAVEKPQIRSRFPATKRDHHGAHTFTMRHPKHAQLSALQAMADESAVVSRLATLGAPVQREIVQRPKSWAENSGKWYTTLNPSKDFDSEHEAQAEEQRLLQQRWAVAVRSQAWDIIGSAQKHYSDGWGEQYGITSDDDLVAEIEGNQANEKGPGEYKIELGRYAAEYEIVPCTIVYNLLEPVTVQADGQQAQLPKRQPFHCGPSFQ